MLDTVSADAMRTAQLITGVTMAIWIGMGVFPPLRPHAHAVRRIVLALYLACCLGFVVYALMGRSRSSFNEQFHQPKIASRFQSG